MDENKMMAKQIRFLYFFCEMHFTFFSWTLEYDLINQNRHGLINKIISDMFEINNEVKVNHKYTLNKMLTEPNKSTSKVKIVVFSFLFFLLVSVRFVTGGYQ